MSVETPPEAQHRTSVARLIAVLGACGFASAFTMRLMDPVVPDVAAEFERTITEVAIFSTAFAISYALSQPILGPIGDALGKARTIRAAAFVLAGVLILSAIAVSYGQMLALRAIAGAVAGGVIPLCLAAIGDRVPMAERQVAIARFLVVMMTGQILGASVSGMVAHWVGWRWVFVLAAVIAVAAGLFSLWVLKAGQEKPGARVSVSGAMDGYRAVFRNPRSVVLYALVLAEGAFAFGTYPYVAGLLADRAGTGSAEAGMVIGASGLGGLVYGLTAHLLIRNLGIATMARLGGVGMAIGLGAMVLPLPWWTAVGFFFVHGFSFFLIHATFQTQGTELAPSHRGAGVALFAMCFFLGHSIGPLVMGAFKATLGVEFGFAAMAIGLAIVGVVAPIALRLPRAG